MDYANSYFSYFWQCFRICWSSDICPLTNRTLYETICQEIITLQYDTVHPQEWVSHLRWPYLPV